MANPYAIKPIIPKVDFGFNQEKTATKRRKHSRAVDIAIWKKHKGICAICREYADFDKGEVDHIIPLAKGGGDTPSNWQWLCHRCNNLKGSKRTNAQVKKILGLKVKKKAKKVKKKRATKSKGERGMFESPELPKIEMPRIEMPRL